MPFTVRLKRSVEKELDDLPAKIHNKVIKTILSLKENPFPHNSKNLHGREGTRIRVGNYRILYTVWSPANPGSSLEQAPGAWRHSGEGRNPVLQCLRKLTGSLFFYGPRFAFG